MTDFTRAIEKAMISTLIRRLGDIGYKPLETYDGEEYVPTVTEAEVLETVFSVDESTISFKKGKAIRGVLIICGNGEDCISDYHSGDPEFNAVIDSINDDLDNHNYNIIFP